MNYSQTLSKARTLLEQGHTDPTAVGGDDQRRPAAQPLVDILPPEAGERRRRAGFLAGRESLPEVPRQERLL